MIWRLRGKPSRAVNALGRATLADPKSVYLRVVRARVYLRLGRFEEARRELDRAQRLRSSFAGTYVVRAWMALFDGRLGRAEKYLVRARRLAPRWPRVYRELARLYRAQSKPDAEARVYRHLLRLDPDDIQAWISLAAVARRRGRPARAMGILRDLMKAHPWEVNGRIALTYVWMDLGRPEKAVEELSEALDLSDDDLEVALGLFRLLLQHGSVIKAKELLGRLRVNAAPEYLTFEAERLLDLGLVQQAKMAAGKALSMDRGNSKALQVLAEVMLLGGHFAESLKLAQKAVVREKDLASAAQKLVRVFLVSGQCRAGDAYLARLHRKHARSVAVLAAWAELQARCGLGGRAISALERRVRGSGLDVRLLHSLALVLEAAGQWQKAIRVAETLLKIDPDDVQALNFVGYTLAEHGARGNRAVRLLVRAQRLSPLDPYVMDSLGWALLKAGELRRAAAWMERAVRMLPLQPEVLEHVADHRVLSGRHKEAVRLYRSALKQAPMPWIRQSLMRKLRSLLQREPQLLKGGSGG